MQHGRLPWPTPEELGPDARRVYDNIVGGPRVSGGQLFELTDAVGRLHGPFNAMLVAPHLGGRLQALGSSIRYETALPARIREIAILVVAVIRRCEFEWHAHEAVGRHVGLATAELDALRAGRPAESFSAEERTVQEVVTRLLQDRDLDDQGFDDAVRLLGTAQFFELTVLVGYYDLLSLILRVFRSPLPEAAASPVLGPSPDADTTQKLSQ